MFIFCITNPHLIQSVETHPKVRYTDLSVCCVSLLSLSALHACGISGRFRRSLVCKQQREYFIHDVCVKINGFSHEQQFLLEFGFEELSCLVRR